MCCLVIKLVYYICNVKYLLNITTAPYCTVLGNNFIFDICDFQMIHTRNYGQLFVCPIHNNQEWVFSKDCYGYISIFCHAL